VIGIEARNPLGIAALLVAGTVMAFASTAEANTYTPNRFGDHTPNGCTHQDCTLREAITRANNHPGADKVVLRGGKTYNLAIATTNEDLNAEGDLDVLHSLEIASSNDRRATIDAHQIDRVIDTGNTPGTVVLRRLRITGGNSADALGGGVLARGGKLRVILGRVVANTSGGSSAGGGIGVFFGAQATILKSTISRNSSEGMDVGDGSFAKVIGSTFSRNTGNNGGGMSVGIGPAPGSAAATIVNSTITKNTAHGSGGGIASATGGPVVLRSVTVARNIAGTGNNGQFGGGIATLSSGATNVRNSIIALNAIENGGTGPDCGGTGGFNSFGRNLISHASDCSLAASPNIVAAHPHLGLLADNGGPTQTLALLAGSKAIDHSGAGAPQVDQRGVRRVRPGDPKPDIGAFERK
jgi:hypothetical protein